MTSARICQTCGNQLVSGVRFCGQCGAGQTPAPEGTLIQAENPWSALLERLSRALHPRYRVLRLIGFGGMAGVYLANEPRLGRRVAIKVMAPGLMVDPALVTRFEQEARTIAQLNHPNIVTVFDVDDRDSLHYFVMAYVPGKTLASILFQKRAPMPVALIGHVFAQTASALSHAHREGIVHRDIKPANILVDAYGNALVTDFGIAKVTDEPSVTRTGLLVGTPTYMSPEQCQSAPITGASDQYSLAVVLFELLTGAAPFTGQTITLMNAHVNQPAPKVRELRPDCPRALAAAIDRMLLKKAEQRFSSMNEAVAEAGAVPLKDDHPLRNELRERAALADKIELVGDSSLRAGESLRLEAVVTDATGRRLPNRAVQWISEAQAIAVVDNEGVVSAQAPGTVRIAAWCNGVAGVATLSIRQSEVPVELIATRAHLQAGEQLELTARLAAGVPVQPVHWSTSDPRIAQVTGEGRVIALNPGLVTITASTGEHAASTLLTISAGSFAGGTAPAVPAPTGGFGGLPAPTPAGTAFPAPPPRAPTPPPVVQPAARPQAQFPTARPRSSGLANRWRLVAAGVFILVAGVVGAVVIGGGPDDPPPVAPGVLNVTVDPATATVTVTRAGGSPVPIVPNQQLEPGSYTVDAQAAGYQPLDSLIEVRSGETMALALELEPEAPPPARQGVLQIAVVPAAATVTVTKPDGSTMTARPNQQLELECGQLRTRSERTRIPFRAEFNRG